MAARRLQVLSSWLSPEHVVSGSPPVSNPELVPFGFDNILTNSQWASIHLQWLQQKDSLGQDIYLLGGHSPLKRWLALMFCARLGREMEYVALTSDTSESDLKQRREILPEGSVEFVDQAPVQAAMHGRVLVIEGLEKVERNVMPVLNNLLENREMALEDGRFLIAASRYDTLSQEQREAANLVRVHPFFRVIALGVPVPPFPGNPLDPPLRSRFQARRIDRLPTNTLLKFMRSDAPTDYFSLDGQRPSSAFVPSPGSGALGSSRQSLEQGLRSLLYFSEALHALGEEQAGTAGLDTQGLAFHQLMYAGDLDLISAAQVIRVFPHQPMSAVLGRIYPMELLYKLAQSESLKVVKNIINQAQRGMKNDSAQLDNIGYICVDAQRDSDQQVQLTFELALELENVEQASDLTGDHESYGRVQVAVTGGSAFPVLPSQHTASDAREIRAEVLQPEHHQLLSQMLQSHTVGRNLCIIGEKGSGKSYMARLFARSLGYAPVEVMFLFQDMTARDLLQRRSTDSSGATTWQPTPLTNAILHGRLAVLDGIHRLPVGTIAVLLRLCVDREIALFDGTRFVRPSRYALMQDRLGLSSAELARRRIFPVHPAFRILALATPPTRSYPWLTNEVLQLFHFFSLAAVMDVSTEKGRSSTERLVAAIVRTQTEDALTVPAHVLSGLMTFADFLHQLTSDPLSESANNNGPLGRSSVDTLTLRQMLRIARRAAHYPDVPVFDALSNAILTRYMPTDERFTVESAMRLLDDDNSTGNPTEECAAMTREVSLEESDGSVRIGSVTTELTPPINPALVPEVLFFDIPSHKLILEAMLQDFLLGENLLLIGNQGVGKNKLADRFLQLLQREREYIQLHRDSTVPSLTLSPSLRDGRIIWQDSPLVRALINGRVLVVDEADKAPTEVVCILKGLLEDGEILLGDGRRFVTTRSDLYQLTQNSSSAVEAKLYNIHPVHKNFRIFALANRPGLPFLGNDFFGEMGDCFTCFAIDNPDQESEIQMLQSYGPTVNGQLLRQLTSAFKDLRQMVDNGILSYPYSTRELVNVVRHVALYPSEPIDQVLENVFSFDSFDSELRRAIQEVFIVHNIPIVWMETQKEEEGQEQHAASPTPVQSRAAEEET